MNASWNGASRSISRQSNGPRRLWNTFRRRRGARAGGRAGARREMARRGSATRPAHGRRAVARDERRRNVRGARRAGGRSRDERGDEMVGRPCRATRDNTTPADDAARATPDAEGRSCGASTHVGSGGEWWRVAHELRVNETRRQKKKRKRSQAGDQRALSVERAVGIARAPPRMSCGSLCEVGTARRACGSLCEI